MLTRRLFLGSALASPVVLASLGSARAGAREVFATEGTAIHGYDPVGYFTEGRPVQGSPDFRVKWMGAVWRFASADTRAQFEMDPHRFAPRYGGYCAYAMTQGAVATTVPEAWTVHEGALYLNYSTGVRQLWQQDIPGFIAAADAHWPSALAG